MEKIHISHLGLFDEAFFENLQDNVKTVDVEVLHHDTKGQMLNSLDAYWFQYVVSIGASLIPLWKEVAGNAKWDAIKYIAKTIWGNTRGQKFLKITSRGNEEKETKMCIEVDGFKFSCEGFPSDDFDHYFEKMAEFYEKHLHNLPNGQRNKLLIFDKDKNNWIEYNPYHS